MTLRYASLLTCCSPLFAQPNSDKILKRNESNGNAKALPMASTLVSNKGGKKVRGDDAKGVWYRAEVVWYEEETGQVHIYYHADEVRRGFTWYCGVDTSPVPVLLVLVCCAGRPAPRGLACLLILGAAASKRPPLVPCSILCGAPVPMP